MSHCAVLTWMHNVHTQGTPLAITVHAHFLLAVRLPARSIIFVLANCCSYAALARATVFRIILITCTLYVMGTWVSTVDCI